MASFDQTRREVARMTLERLSGDGRIHPARIEETVEKCRHDLELQMKREGERAVMELGIHGLHPDLIKLIVALPITPLSGQWAARTWSLTTWTTSLPQTCADKTKAPHPASPVRGFFKKGELQWIFLHLT